VAVRRGEVWTVSGAGYAGKPRPAIIVQADRFAETVSITLAPCTTDPAVAPLVRIELVPDATNGLRAACRVMVDKLITVPRSNLGQRIGSLGEDDLQRVNRAIATFLGLA